MENALNLLGTFSSSHIQSTSVCASSSVLFLWCPKDFIEKFYNSFVRLISTYVRAIVNWFFCENLLMIYRKLLFFITWLLCLTTLPKVFIKFENLSCLIDALKTVNTKLNKSNESSHSCPVPYFKGSPSISPCNNADYRCVTYSLYYVASVSLYLFLPELYYEGMLNFVKELSCIC